MLALLATLALAAPPEITRISWGFTNVYAIDGGEGVVLVDTHYPKKGDKVRRKLRRAGVDPERIEVIVLTHGHPDHAGAAGELREALGVPIVVGAGDEANLRAGKFGDAQPTGLLGKLLKPYAVRDLPPTAPDVVVTDEISLADYGVDGTVKVVGGHTPGSLVVRLDDGRVLVGDLVRGGFTAPKRPKLHFLHSDTDGAHAALGEELEGATLILPGHGGPLAPGRVREWLDEP